MSEESNVLAENQAETLSPEPESQVEGQVNAEASESATDKQEKDVSNGIQERINKITADKYAERQKAEEERKRAEALQTQLDELKAASNKPPVMDEYDDPDKFQADLINYQVSQQLSQAQKEQQARAEAEEQAARNSRIQAEYAERVKALNKPDYSEKANAIPQLPVEIVSEIMQREDAAELVYHLGSHLDVADKLATMSPLAAMAEVGRLSANLSQTPSISAAPNPIKPLSGAGGAQKERGPSGARYE